MGVHRLDVGLFRFRHRAEPHQRPVGPTVGFTPHVRRGKPEIDQAMAGECERRLVKRLQQRAGNHVRLALPSLARPRMEETRGR